MVVSALARRLTVMAEETRFAATVVAGRMTPLSVVVVLYDRFAALDAGRPVRGPQSAARGEGRLCRG
jgi:hypothetical protein